jgi:hypothetical protein
MLLGLGALAAVVVLFAVFAIVSATTESEEPELTGGIFLVPYYNEDTTNGAVAFTAIDGGTVGRIGQVPELMAQTGNNQQWVEVYNTQSGAFLVDRSNGNTSLLLPTMTSANPVPTRLAPPGNGASAAGAAVMGFPTDDGLFIVRAGPSAGYPGDVHLLTASSVAGGAEVGASELPGPLATETLVEDLAVLAGDPRFSGLGDAGRITDTLAAATAGDDLYLVVVAGGNGRLIRVSAPSQQAIDEFEESLGQASSTEPAPPARLTIDELGDVSTGTVLTPLADGATVAAADPASGEVTLWSATGRGRTVAVDGLRGTSELYPVRGGSLGWFAVSTADGWRLVGVGSKGEVRSTSVGAFSGIDIAPPVLVGSTVFTASRSDGQIVAAGIDSGASVDVWQQGVYPVDPELDFAGGATLGTNEYSAVQLERLGSRVSVNVPAAARAVLLASDGSLVAELEKGRARPLDPNTLIDPNRRGDAEEEEPDPDPEEVKAAGTFESASFEREGDSSLRCDEDIDQEPRPALLLPQTGAIAARSINPVWRYDLVSASDCLPSFRVEIDGRAQDLARPNALSANIGGLEPDTTYEVVVISYIGDREARSNKALYRTGPTGPDPATNLRFTDDGSAWTLQWDGCTSRSDECPEPAQRFEVDWGDTSQIGSGSATVTAQQPRSVTVPITADNVGRNLCFVVVAYSASNVRSDPAELCGARYRAPAGVDAVLVSEVNQVPGRFPSYELVLSLTEEGRRNFPAYFGTRSSVEINIEVVGAYSLQALWTFGGDTGPIQLGNIPTGRPDVTFRATFSHPNNPGSDTVQRTVQAQPFNCGPLEVRIAGTAFVSDRWPLSFTPISPCPPGAPAPLFTVNAPPGCNPFAPTPLTRDCTTGGTLVDDGSGRAFGYSFSVIPPEGYRYDGIRFSGERTLTRPAIRGSIAELTSVVKIGPVLYEVTLNSRDFAPGTTPSISGCNLRSNVFAEYRFGCTAIADNIGDFRTVFVNPAPSAPWGPFGTVPAECRVASGWTRVPADAATASGCQINLRKLRDPSDPGNTTTTVNAGDEVCVYYTPPDGYNDIWGEPEVQCPDEPRRAGGWPPPR